MLLCHPNQLAQVFTNLLVNAAQSIEKQGVIHIRTRHEGNEVVVNISDTGKGMAPETRARLFTPFFTTKPRGQGTGLGLSVSQSIISRHQGRIEVESTPAGHDLHASTCPPRIDEARAPQPPLCRGKLSLAAGPWAPISPSRALPRKSRMTAGDQAITGPLMASRT